MKKMGMDPKRKADQTEDQPRKKAKIDGEAKTNPFSLLPDEILHEILSYLNDHNTRWTRLVDYRLFKLIDIRHFNIGLVLGSEMSEVTRVFGRYDKPIGLTFRKADNIKSDFNVLSQLTQLTSLDIGSNTINVAKLTNLQSLTATVEPCNLQHHSRLISLKTSGLQILQSYMYPAHLEQLNIDFLTPSRVTKTNSKLEYYDRYFEAMPNITKLRVAEKSSPSLIPGIRCHLTGLASLVTGVGITDLPVNTMTELFVSANHSYGHVNWSLSHLTNLRRLIINGRRFMKQTSLLPFTLLESLVVRGTDLDAHLTQLNGSNITQLDISLSEQDSLEHVMTFTDLQSLSLELMDVDIGRLSHLTRLTRLIVPCNTVASIGECTKLKNLVELSILPNAQPSEQLFVVSFLTRLTSLELRYSPTLELKNMTNLQDLQILGQYAKPIIGLSQLHNLTKLSCATHSLTDEICTNLTALQHLTVSDVMSDQGLESVAKLTRLTYLHGRTSGSGASLTRLTRLQDFFIHANEGSKKIAKDLHEKFMFCLENPAYTYTYLERNDDTYQDDSDDDYD